MIDKKIRGLKIVSIFCAIILIIEIFYIGYSVFCKNRVSLYFDGINAIENNNSYYVTVGSNNDNSNFYEKAKISKYNDKMEKTFEKLYNVGYNSTFLGVALDGDSVVAVGSYEKTKKDHSNSVRRALFVRYNSKGDIEFEKDFKVLDNSKFTSIAVLEDGYLITGQSIYRNTKVGDLSGGAILCKYDKEGNLLWYKTYGNNKSAIFNDLLIIDDSVFTVGMDTNYLGILCKYDMEGNFISYNDYKYTDDIGFSGITSIDDTIYVSGSARIGEITNALIVTYDTDCTYLDQVVHKTKRGTVRYNKLVVDSNQNLIAIGICFTKRKFNNHTADTFNYDGIIGKYNSSLEELQVIPYGDEKDDYFTDIKIVNGEYYVVGYSSYEDGSYLSKFIRYSDALKLLG